MQRKIPLISRMQGQPKAAPATILRQVETVAQAIDVSIRMAGAKAGFIAASLGVSDAYVSMLRNGTRSIPQGLKGRAFVEDFCRITGTTLLKQAIRWQESLADEPTQAQVNDRLAELLRGAA